jgi:radical SAM protein with 4Fe4S-binding SPASM domain
MNKFSSNIIKLLQKNKIIARFTEDMYSRIPYNLMNGRALNPLSVVLLLTYRCNLRCKMCFYYNEAEKSNTQSLIHKRKNEELTLEQIKKMIDDIAKMNVKVLTLHGGEPLIYPDVFVISKYAAEKGLLVNFITNGILLNDKIIDEIIDARINSITISLDGPDYIHDDVRGLKGAFEKIMCGIAIMKKRELEGKIIPKLSISTYVSAMNQAALMELFEKVKETGITDWNIGLVTYNSEKLSAQTKEILGINTDKGQGDLSSLSDEIIGLNADKMLEIRERLKKENVNAGLQITFPSKAAINKYSDPAFNEVNYCLYPWARIVVSPYGEVFPCIPLSMVNADMGNIKEKSIKDIWNGDRYVQFRKKLKKAGLLPICSKCCTVNNIKAL